MVSSAPARLPGVGRVLVFVYGLLALAATGRSVVQIATEFDDAPFAYSMSALAAAVYILATIALVSRGPAWYRVAWVTIGFELAGVLVVGVLSVVDPVLFTDKTVWSFFGRGYAFVPLVLPVLGMLLLYRRRPSGPAATTSPTTSAPADTGV